MCEELKVEPIITLLIKINEEKDNKINELKGRIDGVGTKLQYLLERLNISVVESRISSVNHNFDAYEIKLDKLVRKIDILEQNLLQYFRSS
jgi:peptidoglycan hydrolase CwlO-like protein